jgi:hypothetical protein
MSAASAASCATSCADRVRGLSSDIARNFVLLPLREALSLLLWAWGFVTRRVHWRDDRSHVTRDGSVQPVMRITP